MRVVSGLLTGSDGSRASAWLSLLLVLWIVGVSLFLFNAKSQNNRLFMAEPVSIEVYFERREFADTFQALSAQMPLQKKSLLINEGVILATLIHFWDPECHCDDINQKHLDTLLSQYSHQIRLIVISDAQNAEKFEEVWQKNRISIDPVFVATSELSLTTPIPASPAVAVLSHDHQLLYIGPYAVGGFCLPNENGIVETILTRLASQQVMKYPFMNGYGCFCPWPARENVDQEVI